MTLKFITFEGGEGTGKSTQAKLLAERLHNAGHEAVLTREPGGSPVAEEIRALILKQKPQSPVAEFLLFAAARAEHLDVTIKPALDRGSFVICDRYIHSTRVYQGALGGIDSILIADVEARTVAPYLPAITFFMDLDPEAGLVRAAQRGALNRYDANALAWHRELREAFLREAQDDRSRSCVLDANRTEAAIAADIWSHVSTTFNLGQP